MSQSVAWEWSAALRGRSEGRPGSDVRGGWDGCGKLKPFLHFVGECGNVFGRQPYDPALSPYGDRISVPLVTQEGVSDSSPKCSFDSREVGGSLGWREFRVGLHCLESLLYTCRRLAEPLMTDSPVDQTPPRPGPPPPPSPFPPNRIVRDGEMPRRRA
jgi:hypothetical protein